MGVGGGGKQCILMKNALHKLLRDSLLQVKVLSPSILCAAEQNMYELI